MSYATMQNICTNIIIATITQVDLPPSFDINKNIYSLNHS